jgi:hypothetical protein
MPAPLTLIQLISEQTMQNLLPLLAFEPQEAIHICSRSERFRAAARHIESAAREAGLTTRFQTQELPAEVPDVEPVRHALKQTLSYTPDAIVNVTGGTKLMSIGAYLGASEFPAPLLYCDTDRQQFVSLGKHALPAAPSFKETARKLTLRIVMAAHGKAPTAWKFNPAEPAHLEFGRSAWSLRRQSSEVFRKSGFSRGIRDFFRSDKGRIPSWKGKLEALCQANLLDALPDPVPPPVLEFFSQAAKAGFLRQIGASDFRLMPPPAGQDLRSHVERVANLLDGSWLELAVLDFVVRSRVLLDPHWSVEPRKGQLGTEDAQSFGETDVICIALPQGNLSVISCKSSLEKPLEHLESLRERSQNLGGRYASAILAVLNVRNEQTDQLRRWGRLLGVRILIGNEIETLAEDGAPA